MNGILQLWRRLRAWVISLPKPRRSVSEFEFQFGPALMAGVASTLVSLGFYYGTLPLLPAALEHGGGLPFGRFFDIAQFSGTFLAPPVPTLTTWIIGVAVTSVVLIGMTLTYASLLAWAVRQSTISNGLQFGFALFVGLGFVIWLADGYQPALMRNAVPDPGFFLIGWTGWATLQLLITCLIFGAVTGALYRTSSTTLPLA